MIAPSEVFLAQETLKELTQRDQLQAQLLAAAVSEALGEGVVVEPSPALLQAVKDLRLSALEVSASPELLEAVRASRSSHVEVKLSEEFARLSGTIGARELRISVPENAREILEDYLNRPTTVDLPEEFIEAMTEARRGDLDVRFSEDALQRLADATARSGVLRVEPSDDWLGRVEGCIAILTSVGSLLSLIVGIVWGDKFAATWKAATLFIFGVTCAVVLMISLFLLTSTLLFYGIALLVGAAYLMKTIPEAMLIWEERRMISEERRSERRSPEPSE